MPEKQVLPGCPECGGATDPFGDHFVSCCKNGFAQRHNAVRDAFHDICVRNRIMVQKEVQASDDDRRRPADLLLLGWDKGKDVAVDFVVSHPLGLSASISIEEAKRHLAKQETGKIQKEGELCSGVGWGFQPAALSPWGSMGRGAQSLVFEIGKRGTGHLQGWAKAKCLREMRQHISITLARRVAQSLQARNRVQDSLLDSAELLLC